MDRFVAIRTSVLSKRPLNMPSYKITYIHSKKKIRQAV